MGNAESGANQTSGEVEGRMNDSRIAVRDFGFDGIDQTKTT